VRQVVGPDKFRGGVSAWLNHCVHVVVECPSRCIGPFLSLILLICFISLLKLGFPSFMLVAWLPSRFHI